jgi:hypothetical protein
MTNTIGLLVVHGIGSQRRGETLAACARALVRAYPSARLVDRSGVFITSKQIRNWEFDEAVLTAPGWQVHLYEVYWASILSGPVVDASFHKFLFEETTWFPWFNQRCGLLPPGGYSRPLMWANTALLWLLQFTGSVVLEVFPRSWHGPVLDQVAADVWNYSHSLNGALPASSPILGAGQAILDRFREAARRARHDGCTELQVVAHSLGTVIAYNALTRSPSPAPVADGATPITRLTTIGSPLEKFLFVWTRLLRPCLACPEIQDGGTAIASGPAVRWTNIYSPWDLVSGRLRRFPEWGQVENKRLWGLGGLATAHVRYYEHPVVIDALAAGLGGPAQPVRVPWTTRARLAVVGARWRACSCPSWSRPGHFWGSWRISFSGRCWAPFRPR